MTETEYCIVCLTTDVKLYGLKDYSLGQIYSDLTKIPVVNWNQHLCFECASLIRKYQKFKLKCVLTDNILTKTASSTGLSKSILKTLQTQYNLHSSLVLSVTTTENVVEIDPISSNMCKVKMEHLTDENISNTDRKDNYMFVSHPNEFLTLPIEYTKQNLLGTHESTDKCPIFNQHSLNPFDNIDNYEEEFEAPKSPNGSEDAYRNQKVIPKTEQRTNHDRDPHKKIQQNRKQGTKNSKIQKVNPKNPDKKIKHDEKGLKVNVKSKSQNKTKKAENLNKGKWDGLTRCEFMKKHVANSIKRLKMHGTLQFLSQEQAKSEVFKRADSDNYINSSYKCKLCFRGFSSEETFANHMVKHSTQKGEYECDNCHSRFPNKSTLYKHMNMYHKLKFTCAKCSYVCEKFDKALKHLLIHEGKTYDCRFCDKKFKVQNSLANHIHLKHQDEFDTQYICDLCGSSFHNQLGLKLHKDMVHFNESNEKLGPACEQCGIHFASQQAWDRHLVVSRNHQEPSDATSSDAKDPLIKGKDKPLSERRRGDTRSYICQFCGHEVTTEYWYKWHLYRYHDQPKPPVKPMNKLQNLICEVCGDKFSNKTILQTHIRKHTGELPFKCQYCGKGFRLQMVLKVHENLHTRAKIYKCDVCDKEFLRRTSHSKHVRQHMGLTPHKCLECDRSFVNMAHLKAHIKHKHENVPYPQRKNPRTKGPKLEKSLHILTQDGEGT